MRLFASVCAFALIMGLGGRPAAAAVNIEVDLAHQVMQVSDRGQTFSWPVSTARAGYLTPRGVFHPTSLQVMHYSSKYENSPMPHSIFFKGGYAIHGTYETASLGRPASHGCVRLSPAHAALLFKLVQAEGARITISGEPPRGTARVGSQRPLRRISAQPGDQRFETGSPVPDYGYSWGRENAAW